MDASLYQQTFLTFLAIMCAVIGFQQLSSPNYTLQERQNNSIWPFFISLILILWLGARPIYGFGDSHAYAFEYFRLNIRTISVNWQSEWIWQWLMITCKSAGLSVNGFFTAVEFGYILSIFWAVKRMMPSNSLTGMLFVWASLSFYTYGTNGLRNGLACHLIILALTYILDKKYISFTILSFTAFGIHRSVLLPIMAIIAGTFFIKNLKYAIYFWIVSIFISLAAGGAVTNFFVSLGFDERMSSYSTDIDLYADSFSQTGFRWDFLLYSSMPILLGWYISVKHKIRDNWFDVICTTYCLCNAFWVMVIRSSFSNRFAYLSWFLYPIVIAYPLINMPVWEDQDRKTGLILFAYTGFTIFMLAVYW